MTYSFAPNDEPLYVSEGDYVQFRFKAPNQWSFTRTVTVTIGELVQYWLITTVPEDFTPDPFPFNNVTEAATDTLYTYADGARAGESIITVSGLTPTTQAPVSIGSNLGGDINNYAMRIDYDGMGYWMGPKWWFINCREWCKNTGKIEKFYISCTTCTINASYWN